jgi:hypothetical protein
MMGTGKLFIREDEIGKPEIVFEPAEGTVWLSTYEIASLLGCYTATVTKNAKSIFKAGILRESDVCRPYRYNVSSGEYRERERTLYNIEIIIALAYRIKSRNSEVFREWLLKRLASNRKHQLFELVSISGERKTILN